MEFLRPPDTAASRVALFPGAFNPPTNAHLTLAAAALDFAGAVIFVLPRTFPHKEWHGPSMEDRLRLIERACDDSCRFGLGVSSGGLFLDMARELREAMPKVEDVLVVCGADAARRAAGWEYSQTLAFTEQLQEYGLLVAPRSGIWQPESPLQSRVQALSVSEELELLSSTAVREAIAAGEPWKHWVPETIHEDVEQLYSGLRFSRNERNR